MIVLVDTPVWSLALRRQPGDLGSGDRRVVVGWAELVRDGRASLFGPIRQEVLSGIRRSTDFERLREALAAFEDIPIEPGDYVEAARFFNTCRAAGIAGTPTDLLICAAAHRAGAAVFTLDRDFEEYAKRLPIRLYRPPPSKA